MRGTTRDNQRRVVGRWLSQARTTLAVALGCIALMLNVVTASAGSLAVATTTVPATPPASDLACIVTVCIGHVTITQHYVGNEESDITLTFDTSLDAAVVVTAKGTDMPYAYTGAGLVPTRHHTIVLREVLGPVTYHYEIDASTPRQYEAQSGGTFTVGVPFDDGNDGHGISDP